MRMQLMHGNMRRMLREGWRISRGSSGLSWRGRMAQLGSGAVGLGVMTRFALLPRGMAGLEMRSGMVPVVTEETDTLGKAESEGERLLQDIIRGVVGVLGALIVAAALTLAYTISAAAAPVFAGGVAVAFLMKPTEESFAEWYKTQRFREATERDDVVDKMISHAASFIDIQDYEHVDAGVARFVFVRTPRNNFVKVYVGCVKSWFYLSEYEERNNFEEAVPQH